jgi:hypothetical protein
MNIFYFDEDPVKAAKVQPDKMLVKMSEDNFILYE